MDHRGLARLGRAFDPLEDRGCRRLRLRLTFRRYSAQHLYRLRFEFWAAADCSFCGCDRGLLHYRIVVLAKPQTLGELFGSERPLPNGRLKGFRLSKLCGVVNERIVLEKKNVPANPNKQNEDQQQHQAKKSSNAASGLGFRHDDPPLSLTPPQNRNTTSPTHFAERKRIYAACSARWGFAVVEDAPSRSTQHRFRLS